MIRRHSVSYRDDVIVQTILVWPHLLFSQNESSAPLAVIQSF